MVATAVVVVHYRLAEKKVTITVKRREAPLSTAMNHSEHNHSEHIDPQKSKAECSF